MVAGGEEKTQKHADSKLIGAVSTLAGSISCHPSSLPNPTPPVHHRPPPTPPPPTHLPLPLLPHQWR